ENLYVGASFSSISIGSFSPSAIGAHVGAKLHPNLAAEARFGIGLGDDDGYEASNYFSLLAKGILPLPTVNEGLSVYALAGSSRVAISYESCVQTWVGSYCASADGNDTGLSLGAGAEFAVTPQISVSA